MSLCESEVLFFGRMSCSNTFSAAASAAVGLKLSQCLADESTTQAILMASLGTHAVQISLEHQGGSVIRATVSESLRGDQLLKAIARRLVEMGSAKVPLVKSLQKFHYIKCNCPSDGLTATLSRDLCQACIQQPKINLSDFAEFGAYTDGYIDITFKKGAHAKAAKKLRDDEWTIRVLDSSPDKAADEGSSLPASFATRFVVVTLVDVEPGDSDDVVLSFATPGVLFHLACKQGMLVQDVMAQIHRSQEFAPDVAVRLVTADGSVLEESDTIGESGKIAKATKDLSDLIPRLRMRTVLGAAHEEPGADRLRESFEEWDADGNGVISAGELVELFSKLAPGLDTATLFKMLAQADLNKDGVLDYDEFVSWILT